MSPARHILIATTLAAGLCAALPAAAQTRAQLRTASAAPMLDLTTGSDEAMRAAKAASIGDSATLGKVVIDNHHTGDFLAVNPSGGPTRSDIGITDSFATR